MCIRIIKSDEEIKYDSSKPLEEQLCGSQHVVINYEPKNTDIDRFTEEVERMCKMGTSINVNVQVMHNNNIKGIKAKKRVGRLMKDLELNEAVKLLVNLQSNTDKKLEELADFCHKR